MIDYESEAKYVIQNYLNIVPGLLQTQDYIWTANDPAAAGRTTTERIVGRRRTFGGHRGSRHRARPSFPPAQGCRPHIPGGTGSTADR